MYRLNGYFHLFILEEMQGNIFSICIVHPLVNQWEGRIAIGLQASDCECEVLSWRIWQIFSSHFILKDLNVCLIRIFSQESNIFSEHLDLNFMKKDLLSIQDVYWTSNGLHYLFLASFWCHLHSTQILWFFQRHKCFLKDLTSLFRIIIWTVLCITVTSLQLVHPAVAFWKHLFHLSVVTTVSEGHMSLFHSLPAQDVEWPSVSS